MKMPLFYRFLYIYKSANKTRQQHLMAQSSLEMSSTFPFFSFVANYIWDSMCRAFTQLRPI